MLERFVSGRQTGVDQAAWRAVRATGIPTGGWIPRGFLTEDGPRLDTATVRRKSLRGKLGLPDNPAVDAGERNEWACRITDSPLPDVRAWNAGAVEVDHGL